MAGASFDDLIPKKAPVAFDDLIPKAQPSAQPSPTGQTYARTIFDQGMQGATFGFADEVSDRIGATAATLMREPKALITGQVTDPDLADALSGSRETTQTRLNQQMREMPGTSIAANILGGVLTGGAIGTTKVGAGVGNILRSGGTAARVGKGALAGAASGGLYGVGSGVDGEKAESAKRGAVLGGALGAAAPLASSAISSAVNGVGNIKTGIFARGEEALNSSREAMRNSVNSAYSQMRQLGADFTPQASSRIANNLDTALKADGPLNPELHKGVLSVVKQMKKGGFQSLEQLDQWRQVLRDVTGNFNDKVNARKAGILIDAIDEEIKSLAPTDIVNGSVDAADALLRARALNTQKAKFEKVSDIITAAAGDANKLKRDLDKLRLSKNVRSWTKEEKDALSFAAKQTTGEGLLKLAGKFGFDLGSGRAIGNTALPVGGAMAAGLSTGAVGPAAVVPIAGTAARMGQKALASGKAEKLLQAIETGKPVQMKEIMALPPKEAQQLLTMLRTFQAPNAAVAYDQQAR